MEINAERQNNNKNDCAHKSAKYFLANERLKTIANEKSFVERIKLIYN